MFIREMCEYQLLVELTSSVCIQIMNVLYDWFSFLRKQGVDIHAPPKQMQAPIS
jgi:hypothetical protein